ncbi:hypothetical protein GCM10009069_27060 [Algimonas arctica]|uniref:Uncharacterized protein n=1 Tax=Algimonas arctica TaxID=1479486 RepID=A0A8J3CUC7_9PROT|nr:hypothetical protein GCM10009069_27060 [Algimonas arctica]
MLLCRARPCHADRNGVTHINNGADNTVIDAVWRRPLDVWRGPLFDDFVAACDLMRLRVMNSDRTGCRMKAFIVPKAPVISRKPFIAILMALIG